MRLYLDDDRYFCLGCGARGDVVQWAQDVQGVGVLAAVEALNSGVALHNAWSRAGIDLQSVHGREQPLSAPVAPALDRTAPERVLQALGVAWAYYTAPALHGAGARYLQGRGIEVSGLEATTGRAEVGLAPTGRARLVHVLGAQGFNDDELVDAGLAHAGLAHRDGATGELADFYYQRVLLPVRDREGNVVGLLGRNLGPPGRPKYKNPPRTAVYNKSADLYQPLPLPSAARGRVVVVEGPLDALAIAACAIAAGRQRQLCPLTQSGRELSGAQVERLAACPAQLVLAFDGDGAGRDSLRRYAREFAALGRTVAVARMPLGHDPASWLAERGEAGLSLFLRPPGQVRPAGPLKRLGVPASMGPEVGEVGL